MEHLFLYFTSLQQSVSRCSIRTRLSSSFASKNVEALLEAHRKRGRENWRKQQELKT